MIWVLSMLEALWHWDLLTWATWGHVSLWSWQKQLFCQLFFCYFSGNLLGPTRLFFGCFSGCFQCQAFSTSLDGCRDGNPRPTDTRNSWNSHSKKENAEGLHSKSFMCRFPHLPVVKHFLHFWLSQPDCNWLKMIEIDWNPSILTEIEWSGLKVHVKLGENLKTWLQRFRMEGGENRDTQQNGLFCSFGAFYALHSWTRVLRPRRPGTCVRTANCPKMLEESSKSVSGLRSESHGAKPYFRPFRAVRNRVCAVREAPLGLSVQRHQITFSTLLKHFWAFRWFWHTCATPRGLQPESPPSTGAPGSSGRQKTPKSLKKGEPLNAPFLNGLFSSGFLRGKTALWDEISETPH